MRPLSITIDSLVHSKVMHWVRQAGKFEVSGFGKIIQLESHLHVVDAILVKQENTTFETTIDPAALGRAMFEMKDSPGTMTWWWHSHGNGHTFFSKTDHDQIEAFSKHGWIAATVFNTMGDTHSGFCALEPFPHYIDDLEFEPVHFVPGEVRSEWSDDYLGKVKNFEVTRHQGRRGRNRRGQDGRFDTIKEVVESRKLITAAQADEEDPFFYDPGL